MRIITRLPVGGIEKRLVSLLPRLNQTPFEVSVCCLKEKGELAPELESNDIPVFLSSMKTRLNPSGLHGSNDQRSRYN